MTRPDSAKILQDCRELLETDVGELIDELGPIIAEELVSRIEATRDEVKKANYTKLRGDIRNRWETLASTIRNKLANQLDAGVQAAGTEPTVPTSIAELQLVSEEELTEQIVNREFLSRVSEECGEEVFALDRRVAHLMGRDELDEGENRLGPAAVCAAVRAGCSAMYPTPEEFALLLRQLERHLRSELPLIYRALNEVLIESDVLPTLKRSYRPAVIRSERAVEVAGAGLINTLERLAQKLTGVAGVVPAAAGAVGGGGGVPGVAGVSASAAVGGDGVAAGSAAGGMQFMASLASLPTPVAGAGGELTNVVSLARQSDAARQVLPLQAITLDIVAMLFDLIFQDEKVPNSIKGLLSRLQIPILKVAMQDQQFFADRAHPARRFLDTVSGVSIRWGKAVDEHDPFYVKLSDLVERIQAGFDDNTDIFSLAIAELSGFVSESEAREAETCEAVALIVQRKNEAEAARRERELRAPEIAQATLAPILAGRLPAAVAEFLTTHWRAVLRQIAARNGGASNEYHSADSIAKALVWSVAPKKEAADRARQAALLPKLLAGLNKGLDLIGVSTDARKAFMDELVELHVNALRGMKPPKKPRPKPEEAMSRDATPSREAPGQSMAIPPPAVLPVPATAAALQVTDTEENGVRIKEITVTRGAVLGDDSNDRGYLRRVKHLVRGDWVEFVEEGKEPRRERLTWISPNRSMLVFSNQNAKAAISITPDALALRLRLGSAHLVERDAPIFENALEGAISALDKAA